MNFVDKIIYFILFTVVFVGCNFDESNKKSQSIEAASNHLSQKQRLDSLNKALVNNPNDANLYFQRAQLLIEQKQPDDALNDLNRALRIDSIQPEYLLFKADLMLRRGSGIEAKKLIQKSIDHNPKHIESLLKMAEIQLYTENYIESIKNINSALRVDVYNARAYYLKGMNYKYVGDSASAVSSFRTAIEQNPEYYEPYVQLGLLFAAVNDPLALSYYDNALKIKPNSIEIIYNKSLFLQENGKPEKAIEGYRLISSIDPTNLQAYYNIGYINLVIYEEYDSAIVYFNKALRLNPAYFDAAYNVGYSYELKGEKDVAKQFYTKTLQLKPDHTLAAKGLGRVN